MTRTSDQVPARPAEQLRADARQNHARLITAATAAFAERGADAPLEDIARRAGVGIGTLYRHFPTRLALVEAAYQHGVETLCDQADDLPQRLEHLAEIEACHSVAGDENYILKVRVPSPAALEDLLQQIRTIGSVSTRTTVVLSTPYENRPPDI